MSSSPISTIGTAAGLAGAAAANRLLESLLFDVRPSDEPTLALVAIVLMLVAAMASAVPAFAGSRTDPMIALRSE